MNRAGAGAIAVLAFLGAPALLVAQDTKDAAKGSVGYAVPEAPALTFLGASSAKVAQPGNARDFAAQLVDAFDELGRVRQGLAIDVRPGYLAPVTLDEYKKFWKRLWYNAALSMGTVQTPGQTGSTDLALGLRLTLIDKGDRMIDPSYVEMLRRVINDCKPAQPGQPPAVTMACLKERSKKDREDWLKEHWNDLRLSLAAASGWRAPGSVLKSSESTGWSAWVSGALPAGRWGQIVGQARYRTRSNEPPTIDAPPKELSFGVRGFLGTGSVNAFAELTRSSKYDLPAELDTSGDSAWTAGIEYRIAENTWISASFGNSGKTDTGERRVALIANLRFGLADESRIKP